MRRHARISRSGTIAFINGCQQSVRNRVAQSQFGRRLHRIVPLPPSQTSNSAPLMYGTCRVWTHSIAILLCVALSACDTVPKRVEIPIAVPCVSTLPAPVVIYSNAELLAMSEGAYVEAIYLDRRTLIRAVAARDALIQACARVR